MSLINTEIKPFKATAYHHVTFVTSRPGEACPAKWTAGDKTLSAI